MIKNSRDFIQLWFHRLCTKEYSYVRLLFFWPIFGIIFSILESDIFARDYYIVHCAIDDMIPFCEYFMIPYMYWFVFLIGSIAYTFFFDVPTFKKLMTFIIITYAVTGIIYIFFPTAQNLRPVAFERDNFIVQFVKRFYIFDTNTNVCPSLHVIGSFAAMFAFWNSKHFSGTGWRIAGVVSTILICMSTLFVKQHSFLDVPPAVLISFIAYPIAFRKGVKKDAVAV